MGTLIAVLNKKNKNAMQAALTMLKTLKIKKAEAYGIATSTTTKIEETIEALQTSKINSPTIIGNAFSKTLTTDKSQPLKLKDATLVFEGRTYPTLKRASDTEAFAQKIRQNREKAIESFIEKADGDFAFVISEAERLIAGRDSLGIRPLYYGENTEWTALASERKALWKIGIKKTDSFPPGNLAIVTKNGFKFKPVRTFAYMKPTPITMQVAAIKLQALMEKSIQDRVSGFKEVALAFSGGLDSNVIAVIARNSGVHVHLIHVSLEDQPETKHAQKMAEELDLPIHVHLYTAKDVEEILPEILWLIEEPDPVKTSIAIPIYWTAEKAAEMNFKVLLAGQGADELFGGYKRYIDTYLRDGTRKAQETIFKDIIRMHESNFERDIKICNFHGIDLRQPFATYEIAEFALSLPIELKMEQSPSTLRKLVLRQLARNIGLPQLATEKPKKAIQYTTGINRTLKKFAKRSKLNLNEYLTETFQAIRDEET